MKKSSLLLCLVLLLVKISNANRVYPRMISRRSGNSYNQLGNEVENVGITRRIGNVHKQLRYDVQDIGITPHIVRGKCSHRGQFKYEVVIYKRKTNKKNKFEIHCGGSIISQRYIITAAHCFPDKKPKLYYIKAGTVKLTNPGYKYYLKKIVTHNYDDEKKTNDIALLKTKTPMELNEDIQPIPIQLDSVPNEITAVVSGWGRTDPSKITKPNILQYLKVKVISYTQCKKDEVIGQVLKKGMHLCTVKTRESGICNGDSGGPLAARGKLIGIASFAEECANPGPDVYTSPGYYSKWIKDNIIRMGADTDADFPIFVNYADRICEKYKMY